MDYQRHSFNELLEMRRKVDDEIRARHQKDPEHTESELHATARRWGYAIDDVLFGSGRSPLQIYQHPRDPRLSWDGDGERPEWVRKWVEGGGSLDELRTAR